MFASISGSTAGMMCRRRMCASPAPMARARITYLRSRTLSVCERTRRAVVVQPNAPMTKMIVPNDGPMIATSTICNARSGITRKKSVMRISSEPTQPPR
jgi:hypothetical protein